MKKGTIIIGKQTSGKTTLAKEIASKYLPHEVVWIHRDYQSPFAFQECTQDTKLVVVDDIESIHGVIDFFGNIGTNIKVQKQLADSFFINPKLLLVYQTKYTREKRLPFFLKRNHPLYDVIVCKNTTNQIKP